jgi:hypothetical protein
VATPALFEDDSCFFVESFNKEVFEKGIGMKVNFV